MTEIVDLNDELLRQAFDAWDRGHLDTAVHLYERLARLGNSDAMINLANMLDDCVQPRDPLGAIFWYMRGFRYGHQSAAWNLAMHYIPRRNHRWFRFWMVKAAEMEHENAIVELARIHADPAYMTRLPFEDEDA